MLDRFFIRIFPILVGSLVIGGLCGLIFVGMGIAAYFDLINMGDFWDDEHPLVLSAYGLGMPIGAFFGYLKFRDDLQKAKSRLAKKSI